MALVCLELLLLASDRYAPTLRLAPGSVQAGAPHPEMGVADGAIGWRMAPHQEITSRNPEFAGVVYRANAQGFRDERDYDRGDQPPPDERRVAFIGDSFTFGFGVEREDCFTARVAAALPQVRAFNLGQTGFGVDQMACAVEEWALPLGSELVVVTFVPDDLTRSLTSYRRRGDWVRKPSFVLDDGRLRVREPEDALRGPLAWIDRTRTAELWRRAHWRLSPRTGHDDRWRLNLELFRYMEARCRAAGVRLVVVHLPQSGRFAPAPAWRRDLTAAGILVLDLGALPIAHPEQLYFERDSHLNASGHAWVAEQLVPFLRPLLRS